MLHKLLVVVLLGALIGLVAWDVSTGASTPKTIVDSPNFTGVTCPSCDRTFYIENALEEGWCPYDGARFDFASGN